jgi:protein-disulfide isomerase
MQKVLIAAAAVAVLVGGWMFYSTNLAPVATPTPVASETSAANSATAEAVDTSAVFEVVIGNPDAPVEIIEYSSFTCPHCANFNQGVYRQIYDAYVATGQVRYVKREVYFDAYGLWAGLVARCGGPDRYSGMIEMLYADQRGWAGQNDGAAVAASLRRIGRRAGMTDDQMNACLEDRDMATAMMETYRVNADAHGIRSTPSFVINGTLHSNMSFEEFQRVIAAAQGN